MTDNIQWACLNDLQAAASGLNWPDPSYMYLERAPERWLFPKELENGLRLERLDLDEALNAWERGRLFCADFELRWESLDGAFQAVYVGPTQALPSFTSAQELDLSAAKVRRSSYALWGNRVPDEELANIGAGPRENETVFIEFQVPRVLYYPVSKRAQRVALQVCTYTDPHSGRPLYYRFCGLEEKP